MDTKIEARQGPGKTTDSRNRTGANRPSLMTTFGTLYREPTQAEIAAGLASLKRTGKQCIQCGKPFNAVRKVAGFIAYQNISQAGMVESRYPLCRRCVHHLKDQPQDASQDEAMNAHQIARTVLETGGRA